MKPNSPGGLGLKPPVPLALKPVSELGTFITGAGALTASGGGWPARGAQSSPCSLSLSCHLFWDHLRGLGRDFPENPACACVGVLNGQRAPQGRGWGVHGKLPEES